MPDDYADRFLPEIMARFTRTNPRVELTVICEPTPGLAEHLKRGNLDLALVTHNDARGQSEVVRREPLLWVSSANHATHEQEVLPMAFGRPTCIWRRAACDMLDDMNREYRVLFTSFSATVITAAVLSGLAISVLPECALRPGMRVLGDADGFGALPDCKIGIMRGHTSRPELVDALARHISESLDNISVPAIEEGGTFDFAAMAFARQAAAAGPGSAGLVSSCYLRLSENADFRAETSILAASARAAPSSPQFAFTVLVAGSFSLPDWSVDWLGSRSQKKADGALDCCGQAWRVESEWSISA